MDILEMFVGLKNNISTDVGEFGGSNYVQRTCLAITRLNGCFYSSS